MRKLSKLKLNAMSEANLIDKEMNDLKGGEHCCTCSCYWEGNGGSSSNDNSKANYGISSFGGGRSKDGDNCYSYCCNDTYDDCCMETNPRAY